MRNIHVHYRDASGETFTRTVQAGSTRDAWVQVVGQVAGAGQFNASGHPDAYLIGFRG